MLPESNPLAGFGFVVALRREAKALHRRPPPIGQFVALSRGSWLGVSGMGPVGAREMALRLIAQGVRGLVSFGTCGGLAPDLGPGALVIASCIQTADGSRYPAAILPDNILKGLGACVYRGELLSTLRPVTTVKEKTDLYQRCGALAVDMESAEIAGVAAEHGCLFLAIRAIVDPATDALPDSIMRAVDDTGHLHLLSLLSSLGVSRERWRELGRLASQFNKAQTALRMAVSFL